MLLTLSNTLKATGVAAVLGLGLLAGATTSASADTIRTQCYGDDCYRVRCNDFGFDCVDIGYVAPARPLYRDRYVCDADGDYCHWVRAYDYDRDYDHGDYDEDF